MPAFIETQFPIARLSAESYKERKAGASQTLTGLGKWWGRKPLILVRASIIGMLMPASNNPKKDREIFLKILTMDDAGVWERCKPAVQRKTTFKVFEKLTYAERIDDCERPENVDGPSKTAWEEINAHLGTKATSLPELVEQLGHKQFGHTPIVGDCFCGGGSIPFEAARIGCESFASDLNPVAGLLTWSSLNLLGGNSEIQREIREVQELVFSAAERQIDKWGIEQNCAGERIDALLYCVEVKPDGCKYFIPLAPTWVISEKFRTVVKWEKSPGKEQLIPHVQSVSEEELKLFKEKRGATVVDSRVVDPFDRNRSWSLEALRGATGLRRWAANDFTPRADDVFQERLYCIRWVNKDGSRRFLAPNEDDLKREKLVLDLLAERFKSWSEKGFIPSKAISSGYNTDQPVRERGWTYWHQLFTPRQLLTYGLFHSLIPPGTVKHAVINLCLKLATQANWNSKLNVWNSNIGKGGGAGYSEQTFANQALNTLFNYGTRSFGCLKESILSNIMPVKLASKSHQVSLADAREVKKSCDLWITDPPYADAVNYHELGDFFLSWYDKKLLESFPDWIPDSRAELAVRGNGEDFRRSMVEIYKNLAIHMPDNGMQMVMFTHQNPAVWADLGMILWAAGLKATAAWTISTETSAGIKKGNYVQGTVCLVLRKRLGNESGFLDEVYPLVEDEVKRQITSMQALDEGEGEPNFNDSDYQLAAYAAALKVLTQYGNIDGKDVEHEVFAVRDRNEKSHFQTVIERALGIACDYLVPSGLKEPWRELSLVERYYLRALDIESRGERRQGMYEELARGFGVANIKPLLKSDKANGARMHTPSGFGDSLLKEVGTGSSSSSDLPVQRGRGRAAAVDHPFAVSPLRHLLFAVKEATAADGNPEQARQYLRDTFGQGYWTKREFFIELLEWLARLANTEGMQEWEKDSNSAKLLAGRLRKDHA